MSDHTSSKDLLVIAANPKHLKNQAIQSIVGAIEEAKLHQQSSFIQLMNTVKLNEQIISVHGYYSVAAVDFDTVNLAIKQQIAAAQLKTLFYTLASALQQLGEEINY